MAFTVLNLKDKTMSYYEDYEDPFDPFCEHGRIDCDMCADEPDEDEWECEFPGNCCMPDPVHHRSECHTPRMAEEYFKEAFAERPST